MFESDTIDTFVVETAEHIPESEDITLASNAPAAHAWPYSACYNGRLYFGSFLMPGAANLIPLRT